MTQRFQLVVLLSLAASIAACSADSEAQPIKNPMLERWCKDHPCGWDVEGEAKRVGTWHPDDYAIELIGEDASLSQLRAELNATLATCFSFSFMAHIPREARAYLELDFLDDGEVEFSELIPQSDWEVRTFNIATPTWYEGVRFRVRKDGPGHVIVAELYVELSKISCPGTPLSLNARPRGAKCESPEQCASASCAPTTQSNGGTCD